jgi:D-galactarolactone cycloisomerase
MGDLTIASVEGIACSVPLAKPVRLGLGMAMKREAVVVKVVTEGGLVGYGEAHHCRAPAAVEALVNTVIAPLVVGMDARETERVWQHVYGQQLATHGMGSGSVCALSGLDLALWDIRGKAVGWPLYRLLGGSPEPITAYAGGVSLGYQPPEELISEVGQLVEQGYTAVKLRVGDTAALDIARVSAVRGAFGDELVILTDANAQYSLATVARVLPALDELAVGWLEEPFPTHARHAYKEARTMARTPLAAGENHYLRYDFAQLLEDGAVSVLQPDVSKAGGVAEVMRIAALAAAVQVPVCPHTSITGINMAATIHVLASLPTTGYFEADLAKGNTLRDQLCTTPYAVSEGAVVPLETPGLGVEVDEEFLRAHPLTPGPGFVPMA